MAAKPDYEKADRIREELRKEGWAVTDTPGWSFVWPIPPDPWCGCCVCSGRKCICDHPGHDHRSRSAWAMK